MPFPIPTLPVPYKHIRNITEEMYTLSGLEEGANYSITVAVRLSEGGTEESSFTVATKTAG